MEFILFIVAAIIISSISAYNKKSSHDSGKRYGNYTPYNPQQTGAGQTQQADSQANMPTFKEGESIERRSERISGKSTIEATVKPSTPKVHSPKKAPDLDCEPHSPIISYEGDPKRNIRKTKQTPAPTPAASILSGMRYDNDALIKGIIYSEIFGKPKGRR